MLLLNKLLVTVLVHPILVTLGDPDLLSVINTRVVTSQKSKPGQFPWHAHLKIKKQDDQFTFCGGSLISKNWIVTAAHCTEHATKIKIGLGTRNSADYEFVTSAKQIIIHDKYDKEYLDYDIALLELKTPAPQTNLISEILIIPESLNLTKDLTMTVCGFSKVKDKKDVTKPLELLWLKVRLISSKACALVYGPKYITKLKFCANGVDSQQNVCDGDSGSGLVAQINGIDYLVGITLFGRIDKCFGAPVGFQRIRPLVNWINEKTDIDEENEKQF